MPFFRTTKNILVDNEEFFDPNWMDADSLQLPPREQWDYQREMILNDVDIWEVIYEESGLGVYASWSPFAEFYLIKPPSHFMQQGFELETFYGNLAAYRLDKRLQELGITLPKHTIWVEPQDMWLYSPIDM